MTKTILKFTLAALAALLIVQGVYAATPYITPTSGDVGTPFTITDPQGRMQPGDECALYLEGTPPDSGTLVRNPVISQDGSTLTGTIPQIDPGNYYVTVRLPGGDPRFNDLAFFAGPTCIPTTEVCNGVDDDCDGDVDESLSRACYSGSPGTEGVGVCHGGTQTCTDGEWAPCSGEVIPQGEVCNLLDDDCDGAVNGGLVPCTPGACDGAGMHVFWNCMGGFCNIRDIKACTKKLSAYYLEEYLGGPQYSGCGEAVQSLLDCSADHGCCSLGTEQEQKQCMDTYCHELYGNVYPTDADGDNYNELYDCDDNNDQVNPAAVEVCDGKDNDCDGVVDECAPGETCIGGTCTTAPSVPEFPTVVVPIGILGAFAIVVLVAGKKLI